MLYCCVVFVEVFIIFGWVVRFRYEFVFSNMILFSFVVLIVDCCGLVNWG